MIIGQVGVMKYHEELDKGIHLVFLYLMLTARDLELCNNAIACIDMFESNTNNKLERDSKLVSTI